MVSLLIAIFVDILNVGPVRKGAEAWIPARIGLFCRCPAALKMAVARAAEASTKESVRKRGS